MFQKPWCCANDGKKTMPMSGREERQHELIIIYSIKHQPFYVKNQAVYGIYRFLFSSHLISI